MLLASLKDKNLIHPPDWLVSNTMYLTKMGSHAYGVHEDSSDLDIYGFTIPTKSILFPHLDGFVPNFGTRPQSFDQWQEHHVLDITANKGKGQEYDFSIYSIVRYFDLLMQNNPNIIDSLFVRTEDIIHITSCGTLLRDNRKMFLHKGCWHKFKGYSFAQFKKIKDLNRTKSSKRHELIERHGFDSKFGWHLVRLLLECEQILTEHDLDLKRNSEILKSVRRGEWTLPQLESWFFEKEKALETVYNESKLPWGPNESKIKRLLLDCLEHHFGSLEKAIAIQTDEAEILRKIKELVKDY